MERARRRRRRTMAGRPARRLRGWASPLARWWARVEIDLSYGLILGVAAGDLALLGAICSAPFTRSLHWLWLALLAFLLAAQIGAAGEYIRQTQQRHLDAQDALALLQRGQEGLE